MNVAYNMDCMEYRIAAYDAGLDFVGCEIDPDYFAAQEARYQAHVAQMSLFVEADV